MSVILGGDTDISHFRVAARRQFPELGRRYQETQEFQKIPGIGPISAHAFDAYIQTPHRFATKQKLWRYCKLGVRKHSSGGTRVRKEKLDPAGHGELKALSHRAVKEALGGEDKNEVQASYRASLQRTGDKTHPRLNTQRKILAGRGVVSASATGRRGTEAEGV